MLELVEPPHEREKTQQTPKEEAQAPEADPPSDVHSEAVKQVPLNPVVLSQAELGNFTTLKTDSPFSLLPALSSTSASSCAAFI